MEGEETDFEEMIMEKDLTFLEKGCGDLGISLSEEQKEKFLSYYDFLTEKNKVMNLTAITEFEEVVIKHFLDSISCVKAVDFSKTGSMIDVGTGAGFPGIPLKIMFPDLSVCLLDSLQKRVTFLDGAIALLKLSDIHAVHFRAEEAARNPEYREKFDLCVSRAVSNLSTLSEYCLPFVKTGGFFISFKSGKIKEELENAGNAVHLLGGKIEKTETFFLPGTDIERTLVVIRKVRPTSGKYPRKAGTPLKEPLK